MTLHDNNDTHHDTQPAKPALRNVNWANRRHVLTRIERCCHSSVRMHSRRLRVHLRTHSRSAKQIVALRCATGVQALQALRWYLVGGEETQTNFKTRATDELPSRGLARARSHPFGHWQRGDRPFRVREPDESTGSALVLEGAERSIPPGYSSWDKVLTETFTGRQCT